jgi:hypothetical protein
VAALWRPGRTVVGSFALLLAGFKSPAVETVAVFVIEGKAVALTVT